MRKHLYLLFLGLTITISSFAAVGDTTIVQAHDTTWLSWYGNYDTTVKFPDGSKTYRRIYMTFTLGKYHCPGSPTYCGDWDYTVLTYLMTKTGDTLELGRLISPYANAGSARTPWTWKQHYVFDVTDYYPLLKDSATVRVLYSGYSGGFTANVKFTFIEGTPDRNVIGITRLWHGSPGYGGTTPIDTFFKTRSLTAPATTQSAVLKFLVTGHGSDANGCCEFASHYYKVTLNSSTLATTTIWRDNCGSNELYPQTGTWIYQRGNWCPGAMVYPFYHNLTGIVGDTNYSLALNFEPYTVASPSGIYTSEAHVFYYGAMNKTLDASLDGIIAPTTDENYFRENATSGNPVIHVKNTGSTAITSLKIQYGVVGYYMPVYRWTGNIAALQETDITLPQPWELRGLSGKTGTFNFTATIQEVNGTTDGDASNNTMTSSFTTTPIWPFKIAIQLKTNGSKMPNGYSETSWMIFSTDDTTTPVAKRVNNAVNTTYNDTVSLSGSYKLVVIDSGCDGINWWNFANYTPNPGIGSIKVTPATSFTTKALAGYYNGDFGCGFTQYFTAGWSNVGVNAEEKPAITIETYPNPVVNELTLKLSGLTNVKGDVQIVDAMGRVLLTNNVTAAVSSLHVASLQDGVYTVVYTNKTGERLQTRIIIAK